VTIKRHNWFRGNFIANRAACAATGKFRRHLLNYDCDWL
jgi:hypothetical protein